MNYRTFFARLLILRGKNLFTDSINDLAFLNQRTRSEAKWTTRLFMFDINFDYKFLSQ